MAEAKKKKKKSAEMEPNSDDLSGATVTTCQVEIDGTPHDVIRKSNSGVSSLLFSFYGKFVASLLGSCEVKGGKNPARSWFSPLLSPFGGVSFLEI